MSLFWSDIAVTTPVNALSGEPNRSAEIKSPSSSDRDTARRPAASVTRQIKRLYANLRSEYTATESVVCSHENDRSGSRRFASGTKTVVENKALDLSNAEYVRFFRRSCRPRPRRGQRADSIPDWLRPSIPGQRVKPHALAAPPRASGLLLGSRQPDRRLHGRGGAAASEAVPAPRTQAEWVKKSNENARLMVDLMAKLQPETAAQFGVEGYDEEITDLSPGFVEQAARGDSPGACRASPPACRQEPSPR